MKSMGLNEIRSAFLKFYESKDHYVTASYSLVPQGDKSLLLVNAGMQPLKNYFMGTEVPPKPRMATCQKCIRTGDIENVGITARHATFFEMLGNFSFGDYFKRGSIEFGWEFITEVLELPIEKLWPSVYYEDEDAFEIWRDVIGIPEERITRLGKEDNFWEIGTGPCGPCSEIYFDRGEAYGCGSPDCKPGCECDRFLEFWNHVFTQYDKDDAGVYHPLAKPNIDTGMGLERIACIMQDVDTIFEVDTIQSILSAVVEKAGVKYGETRKQDTSIRIITDHVKAITFMVADGIMPNNEGRGYVLRRLLRRAARHARLLGMSGNVLTELVDAVLESYGPSYNNLIEKEAYIKKVIENEEMRFQMTIDQGLSILNEAIDRVKDNGETVLSGEDAFKLYDTYGFPLELTKEILEEQQLSVDEEAFNTEMAKQKERARTARGAGEDLGWTTDALSELPKTITSKFIGYDYFKSTGEVLAIVETQQLESAVAGMDVIIVLDQTPFYPEGGGQIGDVGIISGDDFKAEVLETTKGKNGVIAHRVHITEGIVTSGQQVTASVNKIKRMATARNHSMTHILHKTLRDALGEHVEQAGSYVTPERLRFDFSHFEAIPHEVLLKIEKTVNAKIFEALPIITAEMGIDEARQKGAMALFGEKYGKTVRVVTMGDYSIELCGGTHLKDTSEAGMFKIVSEAGVAAGVRRIEAITGENVYKYLTEIDEKMQQVADILKANASDVIVKAEAIVSEMKQVQRENEHLKQKLVTSDIDGLIANAKVLKGVEILTAKFEGMDTQVLRNLGDQLLGKLSCGFVVFANVESEKVTFVAMASDDAVKAGAHAGNIIREVAKIAGGGGGGKPNMAQAGGKNPAKVDEALEKVYALFE
ncbi:alanine--tRNA ligase [Fusibacter paucivorans]|uniref:Alanine--tRNA ligase n=1 Tax=Fusibacter paucivorans TaxID=76009 RepID=A0ABS5PNG8_9FIRM|nr:alanine--tRNA ligase [Fusibacter paucivorans]MBS7526720.1 alanine--tRNA ligase [Fusibacter paucivorans]